MNKNLTIKWHSRAGQGAILASNFLSDFFAEIMDCEVQNFPEFGAEKRGAPVVVFNKISREKKVIHSPSIPTKFDIIIILDNSLLDKEISITNLSKNLKSDGIILLNSKENKKILESDNIKFFNVDASGIAMKNFAKNIPNIATLGALTKILDLDTKAIKTFLKQSLQQNFNAELVDKNLETFSEGFKQIFVPTKLITYKTKQEQILDSSASKMAKKYHPVINNNNQTEPVKTGLWAKQNIQFIPEHCVQCQQCFNTCPDGAIIRDEKNKIIGIDKNFCKNCGLCVSVCPTRLSPDESKHALKFREK